MADSSKNDLLHLIKRIGAYLSTKVSKFLNIQDLRSFWAIAGLAVAVIYTWRVLRTSNGSRSKQPKRPAPAPSTSGFNTHPNENVLPSGVGSSSKDSRAQSAIDEFFQPANPTLGQIVRQKLGDGRKVTCRLLGVILEENTPEELQNQATVRSSVLEVLLEITKYSDLYLMESVLDDESEKKVLTALENAGVFTSGDLVKDKVLFCSTEKGRMSFVRQLEPDWHIDSNPEITSQLARFIKHQLHIKTEPERIASNVFTSSSLEQFFGV
ncbi:peroxisome biogenesis protein 22-like isoform X2 [Cynara cardunculus var. scolymus]|uniref:peroxisome biogenesis protein 22-like isoform X2 n=1 Tax=Cynara cardunculus var. scolymus TaxID=59895 RepID=UPI000D627A27|nr:peroxisome biogenesis protein 22-like isoform X2 [Cynara cardunculus var. scolymus]